MSKQFAENALGWLISLAMLFVMAFCLYSCGQELDRDAKERLNIRMYEERQKSQAREDLHRIREILDRDASDKAAPR